MSPYSILFCFTDSCLRLQRCFIHIKLRVLKRLCAVFDTLQLTCRKKGTKQHPTAVYPTRLQLSESKRQTVLRAGEFTLA